MDGDTPNKLTGNVTAALSGNNVQIGWNAVVAGPISTQNDGWPAADGYNVYVSTDPYWNFVKFNTSLIPQPENSTSTTPVSYTASTSGLKPNTTYYVRVSPSCNGYESGMYCGSNLVSFITPAAPPAPTIVSAVTDHIGKEIILTFDRPMKDPSGNKDQFTVTGITVSIDSNGKANYPNGNVPVTSAALGSDPRQIILNMSTSIQNGAITLNYTKGTVEAADGTLLESFTNQAVTNNNVCYLEMADFDSYAAETAYDTSDVSYPILKFKYNNPIDYDNVQLAWYLYNGFFTPMVDNVNNYVKFYEKDSGEKVQLPNILTRPNSPATYKNGISSNEQVVTDWYFGNYNIMHLWV